MTKSGQVPTHERFQLARMTALNQTTLEWSTNLVLQVIKPSTRSTLLQVVTELQGFIEQPALLACANRKTVAELTNLHRCPVGDIRV